MRIQVNCPICPIGGPNCFFFFFSLTHEHTSTIDDSRTFKQNDSCPQPSSAVQITLEASWEPGL